jgi:hypothetical protein
MTLTCSYRAITGQLDAQRELIRGEINEELQAVIDSLRQQINDYQVQLRAAEVEILSKEEQLNGTIYHYSCHS